MLLEAQPLSKFEMMESLTLGGLALPPEESFAEDGDEYGLDPDESPYSALERLGDDILAQCRTRGLALGDSYPFVADSDILAKRAGFACDAYAFLLIADIGHDYPQLRYALTPDAASGLLMEKVVEASARGLFGRGQRFGWPREPDWPTDIDGRVRTLADSLDLDVELLGGKTDPADKDRTLDVVAMLCLNRGYDASIAILIQCAAGSNWKSKLGHPSITAWSDLLRWKATLVRAIAIPWRLGSRATDWTYSRVFTLSGGAMVLDRPRLLEGNPDAHLDPAVRPAVQSWWSESVSLLPRSGVERIQ